MPCSYRDREYGSRLWYSSIAAQGRAETVSRDFEERPSGLLGVGEGKGRDKLGEEKEERLKLLSKISLFGP